MSLRTFKYVIFVIIVIIQCHLSRTQSELSH